MAEYPPVRIQIRKPDRDEFEVYRWGDYEDGEIKKRYEEGESRFGPFEDFVENGRAMMDEGANPSNPLNWLYEWPSFGSMAQSARASVIHPALDREFVGMRGYSAVGALQGLEHPQSTYEDIHVLEVGHPDRGTGEPTLRIQFEVGEFDETVESEDASPLEEAVVRTVKNILRFVSKASQFRARGRVPFDSLVDISVVQNNILRYRLKFETEGLSGYDLDGSDLETFREKSTLFFDAREGWKQ